MVGPGFDVRKNYHRILGVSADQCDFKGAFFKHAKQTHPDKGGHAERFKEIREAYEVLTDPGLREAYNAARLRSAFASSAPPPPPPRQRERAFASTKPRPSPSKSSHKTKPQPASGKSSHQNKPKPSTYSYYESEDDSNDDQGPSDDDTAIPQSSLPPEFRQRKPAPYSSSAPKQPKQSQRSKHFKADPHETKASTKIPPLKSPESCVFSDYYTPDFRETSFLQRLRADYRTAWRSWRDAADEALDAKHTMEHCLVDSWTALLDWERKEAAASELQRKKWAAERVKKAHMRRAKVLKARKRAAEAKVRSADQYTKRAGARREREARARFGMGSEWDFC